MAMNKKRNIGIRRWIGIAACFAIIFSGIVYAKDIENYVKKLFTRSTEAMDTAVENGYVQKVENGYVYDKDIGIKVDNLVIDDLNLAISFSFDTSEYKDITAIDFKDFTITNDNNKVIYRSVFKTEENIEDVPIYTSAAWGGSSIKTSDTTFSSSILIGLKSDAEKFEKIDFDIKSISLSYSDNKVEVIEGDWKFDVTISEEMRNSPKIIFTLKDDNEYIESCKATVTNTGTIIEFTSKEDIPREFPDWPPTPARIYLNTHLDKTYRCLNAEFDEKNMTIRLDNIGIHDMKDVDELELYIGFFNTTLILEQE